MINGQIIRFLFLLHSLGVFLMLGVPALWHTTSNYSHIGFLGLNYDPIWVAGNVHKPHIAVIYVYTFTTFGFVLASRLFVGRLEQRNMTAHNTVVPQYLLMTVLFAMSWLFFTRYYGNFGMILLLRAREIVDLPIYFELLRGSTIALHLYVSSA